jgi:carbon storage regulator CsrA
MLVLSRKKDESIVLSSPDLDEEIKIVVVNIDTKNRVKIGIEANKNVKIVRQELKPLAAKK